MSFMTDPFHDIIQELSDQNKILQAELTKLQIEKNVLKLDNEIIALEWFKKGLQHAYCNVMELDPLGTYAYLEDMYEETDAGTIGPLKKEEV